MRLIFSHLERTGLVNKGLYMAKKRIFSCGINGGNPERPILPARVANQNFHLARSWI